MTDKKVAIITGASRGIGAATAELLAFEGWIVILTARSDDQILENVAAIEKAGGEAYGYSVDVSQYKAVKALVERVAETFGKIDLYVNNAGVIDPISRIGESDPEAWSNIVDINLKGVYYGLRFALPQMEKQGSGTIINISSGAANSFLEGWSHYCATKAGVLRLTGVAHKEYGDKGVRIVGLSPGTVATDMQKEIAASGINPVSQIPWENHITPSLVARAISYLAGEGSTDWLGRDFSLKTEEGRRAIGMV